MQFLENLKRLIEVAKNKINVIFTMPIALFGKVEQHEHHYHGPAYINPTIYHVDKETALEVVKQNPHVRIAIDETAAELAAMPPVKQTTQRE